MSEGLPDVESRRVSPRYLVVFGSTLFGPGPEAFWREISPSSPDADAVGQPLTRDRKVHQADIADIAEGPLKTPSLHFITIPHP